MNYYFLLEDEQSFIKVLPKWLEYMGFLSTRVADIKEVCKNNYVMQSGQGICQLITRVLYQTIDTIMANPNVIDELIVILDSEDKSVEMRRQEVEKKIENYQREKKVEIDFKYKIFVCNHCFESMLLGNRMLYPKVMPENTNAFWNYYHYYNISEDDPEEMKVPSELEETTAKYHFHYLHEACRYNKIRYSKNKMENVAKKEYFQELVNRINETDHIKSFRELFEYFSISEDFNVANAHGDDRLVKLGIK
jgi:hypothetical protein